MSNVDSPAPRRRRKLQPPAGLVPEVEQYFRDIVNSAPSDHFFPFDITPLVVYCEALHAKDRAERGIDMDSEVQTDRFGKIVATPWVAMRTSAWQTIASLAVKLRLTPSSRHRIEDDLKKPRTKGEAAARSARQQENQGDGLAGLTFQPGGHTH